MTKDLFNEFSPSSKQEWLDQVTKELKGKNVAQTLHSRLWERIAVEPFYSLEDVSSHQPEEQLNFHPESEIPGLPPRIWDNLVSVYPDDSNGYVLNSLSNGAEGLILHLYGMENLEQLLNGVLPQYISILVKPLGNPVMALQSFFNWVDRTGASPKSLKGGLLWSPSDLVFQQNESFELGMESLRELVEMSEPYPEFKSFSLNTSRYTDTGANPLDALVFGIGELIEVLDRIGLDPELIFRKMIVEASVGDAHFGEIARLKSLRKLVCELAGLYGIQFSVEELVMFCKTSDWSKSVLDPHTNLIRQTYEAMASVLGGANLIWVKSIQDNSEKEMERRIARNVSSILKEEAYLDKVKDPAAGSFFLGNLVQKISGEIKSKLQDLESRGGWLQALQSGEIHTQVRSYRERIQTDLAESKLPKIGVNKYPTPEKPDETSDFEVFEEKPYELKSSRASYLFELQTLLQP